jgi:transglutaminase-like putative cysteine protease
MTPPFYHCDQNGTFGVMHNFYRSLAIVSTTFVLTMGCSSGSNDNAHIFMAATRMMGHPSRYVSGYLLMDGVKDQVASHAWAEAHIGGLGWVGFDCTNDTCPDERYVGVATGRDYRDAAPVSGILLGQANERLAVSVTVEQ